MNDCFISVVAVAAVASDAGFSPFLFRTSFKIWIAATFVPIVCRRIEMLLKRDIMKIYD